MKGFACTKPQNTRDAATKQILTKILVEAPCDVEYYQLWPIDPISNNCGSESTPRK
jgi:hypothetical protein